MIAERNADVAVTTNIEGERVAMSIDENAMAHIMSVLTDLYSNPELAVLREYSTNARDAHVEAGQKRPIEVTLPSNLAPFLTVKDYGVGLSVDDITAIYSKYGASTKRMSNDFNGMLGLGCKSALTYTPQFTVVGVKDGMRAQVAVSRDEHGAGAMTIVDHSPTEDPNGVEIVVPARRNNNLAELAADFFSYWDEGTVLVNGEQPKRVEGLTVTNRLMVVRGEHYDDDRLVMGGVSYPLKNANFGLQSNYHVVAFVGIGEVNFTPSREALQYTAKTKATIQGLQEEFAQHFDGAVQKAIDKAPTPLDAFAVAASWRGSARKLRDVQFSYKGTHVPKSIRIKHTNTLKREDGTLHEQVWYERMVVTDRNSTKVSGHSKEDEIPAGTAMRSLWVHGYKAGTFTPTHKRKLLQWADANGFENVRTFVLTDSKVDTTWVNPANMVPWEPISAIKLKVNRNTNHPAAGRLKGSYDVLKVGTKISEVPADDLITDKPLYYLNTTHYGEQYGRVLSARKPDSHVVLFTNNRQAKFLRDFPKAKPVAPEITKLAKRAARKVPAEAVLANAIKRDDRSCAMLKSLDLSRVDDPQLHEWAALAKDKEHPALVEFNALQPFTNEVVKVEHEIEWTGLDKLYPLWYATRDSYNYRYNKSPLADDHIYLYLNALYAKEN